MLPLHTFSLLLKSLRLSKVIRRAAGMFDYFRLKLDNVIIHDQDKPRYLI